MLLPFTFEVQTPWGHSKFLWEHCVNYIQSLENESVSTKYQENINPTCWLLSYVSMYLSTYWHFLHKMSKKCHTMWWGYTHTGFPSAWMPWPSHFFRVCQLEHSLYLRFSWFIDFSNISKWAPTMMVQHSKF